MPENERLIANSRRAPSRMGATSRHLPRHQFNHVRHGRDDSACSDELKIDSQTACENGIDGQSNDDEDLSDQQESVGLDSASEQQLNCPIRRRPHTMIDWRHEICTCLNESPSASDGDILNKLYDAFEELKEARLQELTESRSGPPRFQEIHRIVCADSSDGSSGLYEDTPWIVEAGPYLNHLRGSNAITNLEVFLERNKDISFIVYKDYECCERRHPSSARGRNESASGDVSSLLKRESVAIISPDLRDSFDKLASLAFKSIPYPKFEVDDEDSILFPYMWWFHSREKISDAKPQLDDDTRRHIDVFDRYIQDVLTSDWQKVDEMTARGKITAEYINYIYVPGQLVISKGPEGDMARLIGLELTSWLEPPYPHNRDFGSITAKTWSFDGNFQQTSVELKLASLPSLTEEFDVTELEVYPASFASPNTLKALQNRGEMFWKCRKKNYVFHTGLANGTIQNTTDLRFMIDMETYNKMHPKEPGPRRPNADELGAQTLRQDKPSLGDSFYLCLPTTIYGFNMQKKEWVNLEVHYLEDVQWNTEAFDLLVIESQTKALIKAVVMNQLGSHAGTDLIHGKGNGLFMLLHGSPGTGKTLTAESVAEIAKKPLYRVTCGDIGTKADDVEKYLETVLLLGKTWGCVVLLDEADVFLEQRSLLNLERNALVSVFLRVLEYYEGILILTSNRVGTFDEAFKSRIQLALRYKTLQKEQRLQIWKNFIRHLDSLQKLVLSEDNAVDQINKIGYGIRIDEIFAELDTLAEVNLNGREIRNAMSTARQLALFKKQPMGMTHLKDVIAEAQKFDDYLKELKDGFTQDEIQRAKRER
ncbi:hypothetical protein QQS21_007413 [Conoideocrella luteorostrata]|uniref:AAA+ ATPase domain-containing protein n=1 Tax=Conoideocrella luteorostrata TaxID=1105319 RepID=A0AAJ0CKS0_9HYPO|nr:hypothetical protein QQS21_007413 [Conoideocrella luteorostrata]